MERRLMPARRPQPAQTRLRLDPVACDGVGMCSHLAPELVRLDPWGFPLLPDGPLAAREPQVAKRAVSACPRRALFLEDQLPG
jgi:ferredoxin